MIAIKAGLGLVDDGEEVEKAIDCPVALAKAEALKESAELRGKILEFLLILVAVYAAWKYYRKHTKGGKK